jgi:hypothetical protein
VAGGATLRFNRNALNTPVYLLATSNVTIAGTIDVSGTAGTAAARGLGGPGGFDGGNPRTTVSFASAGHGPGAGPVVYSSDFVYSSWGSAAYATVPSLPGVGSVYGSPLLVPLLGGSGGGGGADLNNVNGHFGDGGGGAVLLASNTRIEVIGAIRAKPGTQVSQHAGSGGAIRLLAPVVTGSGTLDVGAGGGGHGRVRIDGFERSAAFNYANVPAVCISGGAFMTVFPPSRPRLDIVEAAGTSIALDTPSPVSILLPLGSSANRTIKVRAENFGTSVPVQVVLTPAEGERIVYTTTIDNIAANPATNAVDVVVPANVVVKVNAWTP